MQQEWAVKEDGPILALEWPSQNPIKFLPYVEV